MRESVKGWLITFVGLIFPITVLALFPSFLYRAFHQIFSWQGSWRQWLGVWLIANGTGLMAWCVKLFRVEGRGTPLPIVPPKQFVANGPYRYVRNPMFLGVFLTLGGEALACGSPVIGAYLLVVIGVAHLVVRVWEEPQLRRRFGPAYHAYQQQVPRWIPRVIR
ncbi:MAG: isoprenylcysteine carboxylmethyltransferase family protein [Candidatus Omnitrophica bacterium]|nr:isoprenylcysteine carboxylmethyltransferase family protein [Candidatus Omnitrophota bacterium]